MAVLPRIVDAHLHLWDLTANYYPWLSDGNMHSVVADYSSLRRNYVVSDLRKDIGDLDVRACVHIQAEHDPSDHVRETRWLTELAGLPASKGLPTVLVANADLAAPDADEVLARHCEFDRVRGIRQGLHRWLHEKPLYDPLTDPAWQKNFGLLAKHDLSFDLQFYVEQGPDVVSLVKQHPEISFIATHCGMPMREDEAYYAAWLSNMRSLSVYDNVGLKISGFGLLGSSWDASRMGRFVDPLMRLFSPSRCMLASNYPVEGIHMRYAAIWNTYHEYFRNYSADERAGLFGDNAARYYRIDL